MSRKDVATLVIALLAVAALPLHGAAQQDDEPEEVGFFITSAGLGSGGDLGGLAGADVHCRTLAAAAGAGDRMWRAYLSTHATETGEAVHARDRIGEGPWADAEGVRIASDVDDLHYNNANARYEHALDERGERVNSGPMGDSPTMHDILTGGAGLFYCFAASSASTAYERGM